MTPFTAKTKHQGQGRSEIEVEIEAEVDELRWPDIYAVWLDDVNLLKSPTGSLAFGQWIAEQARRTSFRAASGP